MTTSTNALFVPCQIKFAFDMSTHHCASWPEYFGFEDEFDMLQAFMKNAIEALGKGISDNLAFNGTDGSGSKFTAVFEYYGHPAQFNQHHDIIERLLTEMNSNPPYNENASTQNNMLSHLEEEGITIYEDQPISEMYEAFNLIQFECKTYQDRIAQIAQSAKRPLTDLEPS